MTTPSATPRVETLQRREVLGRGALFAGLAVVAGIASAPRPASAAPTIAKNAVAYQATPKGAARCDKCKLWVTPAACKLVQGPISPTGWCTLYAPAA